MGLFFLTVFVVCTFPALAVSQETTSPAQAPQSHADHQMDTAPHADNQSHTGSGMDAPSHSEHQAHAHHAMRLDASGMVMNENTDELPRGCPRIAAERHIRVSAGREFARDFRGTMFTYDQREWTVEPCTRLTVSLTSLCTVPVSLGMVTGIGLDPADFHVIVAKGVHAPAAAFGPVCSELIRVDTIGATAADMRTFEYRYRRRPMYPFEEIA